MSTYTLHLKEKLETEVEVVFVKDEESGEWKASIDGLVIATNRYLGNCVHAAAKELGE